MINHFGINMELTLCLPTLLLNHTTSATCARFSPKESFRYRSRTNAHTCPHNHARMYAHTWMTTVIRLDAEVCLRIEINGKRDQKICSRLTSYSSDDCLLLIIFSMMVDWIHVLDFLALSIGQIFADLYWKYWCWYIVILFIIHIFDDIKITSCVGLGCWFCICTSNKIGLYL